MHTTALREDARRLIHRAVGGGADDRRALLRLRLHSRDRHADPRARTRPLPPAPGGVHRPLRAPLERVALARVGRRRGHDPRGRRRAARQRPSRSRAPPPRRPAAEDRQLLRRLQRDGDHHRRRPRRPRAAAPRRAVLLGLRDGRAVPADRHGRQGRGVPLPAQVRRRPGHARRAGRQARAPTQPRAVGTGWRDDPLRQPARPPLPPGSGGPRGGRHTGDRRFDPRRPRVRAQGAGRSRGDSPPRARLRPPRTGLVGPEPEDRDPRQHVHRAAADRLVRAAPSSAPVALELRRRAAQRPVRDPGT